MGSTIGHGIDFNLLSQLVAVGDRNPDNNNLYLHYSGRRKRKEERKRKYRKQNNGRFIVVYMTLTQRSRFMRTIFLLLRDVVVELLR